MFVYYIISTIVAIIFGIIMLKKYSRSFMIEIPIRKYIIISCILAIPVLRVLFIIFLIYDYFKNVQIWKK